MGCTASKDITIAWVGPLTGDVASLGIANFRGVQLAVQQLNAAGGINGRQIVLVAEDDQYVNQKSVTAFTKVTSVDRADAVLMATYGGLLAVAPTADQEKIVAINSLDTSDEIARVGDYVFGIGIYDEGIGMTLADYMISKGIRKVALVYYQDDPFFPLVKNGFKERFEKQGGVVVLEEAYSTGETDFRSRILKVKDADVEALGVLGYDEGGLVLKQAAVLGLNATFFGADTVTATGFLDNAGPAAEDMIFTFWSGDSAPVNALVDTYKTKYGEEPHNLLFTAVGYDAMQTLAQAMKGKDLKTSLYAVSGFEGLTGTLTMSADGIVRTVKEGIYTYSDGKIVPVVS